MWNGAQIIPLDGSSLREAFDVRLEELNVIDLKFLSSCEQLLLAVLHEVSPHSTLRGLL
jgi:hypothetical protein